jgi:hypothetical protein
MITCGMVRGANKAEEMVCCLLATFRAVTYCDSSALPCILALSLPLFYIFTGPCQCPTHFIYGFSPFCLYPLWVLWLSEGKLYFNLKGLLPFISWQLHPALN